MSDKEDIPNEKTIYLKLGDVIKINKNEYYIQYIDETKIKTTILCDLRWFIYRFYM